jgi:signal transduction histidine kinase
MNAVEHNPNDQKHIWVNLQEHDEGYLVTIGDDGVGISDTRKTELFDVARRFGGIGLHQSSQIIEKYDGWIQIHDRVKDQPELGAEFRLFFPKPLPNGN